MKRSYRKPTSVSIGVIAFVSVLAMGWSAVIYAHQGGRTVLVILILASVFFLRCAIGDFEEES